MKQLILKSQQRFRIEIHNIFTEVVNKIAFSVNDDKILQQIQQKQMHMEQAKIKYLKKKRLNVTI